MALWHFMQGDTPYSWTENDGLVSSFDDGLNFIPGEDAFSSSAADAKAAAFGADPQVVAVYTGTPGYAARIEAEAQAAVLAQQVADAKASADAVIDALLNPISQVDAERAAVNAQFDALLAASPDRSADIAKLREQALAALELQAEE